MDAEASLRAHYDIERPLADRLRQAATQEDRRRLYGEVYGEYRAQIAATPDLDRRDAQPENVSAQSALVLPFLGPECVFLEIGAGDGAVAARVAAATARSIALDVNGDIAVEPVPNFEFRVFDGFDLGVPAESVDFAFSNDVIEHLHHDDALDHMRAVRRVLKRDGRYLCVTPNRLWGPHDVSGYFGDTPRGFHLAEYTAGELGELFHRAGFGRVRAFLSWRGRRLTPFMPLDLVRRFESAFGRLPRSARRRYGVVLAAIKVVGSR